MNEWARGDRKMAIVCPFCGGKTRERVVTAPELAAISALYLAHLIESHWAILEAAHEARLQQGPVNDAWTRL